MQVKPGHPTRTPLVRVVDLNVGESQEVELCDGKKATVKLLGTVAKRFDGNGRSDSFEDNHVMWQEEESGVVSETLLEEGSR